MWEHKKHFTITEAAILAEVSRPLVYRAVKDGSLKTWKTWSRGTLRIHREDLEAWMQRTETPYPNSQSPSAA